MSAFTYRPTNKAYGKGIPQKDTSTWLTAIDKKTAAKNQHLFYSNEKTRPAHQALEIQIARLNDTKDLVSEMPRRPSLTEQEYQAHLKEETYNPKPTIFPIRGEPTVPSPTSQKENQPSGSMYNGSKQKKKTTVDWGEYKPKHQEWGCSVVSSFQRDGTKKEQHFAYETSANVVGKKDKSEIKEEIAQRLGNRFTNSFNMHKFHDTALYTQVEHSKVHGRSKYPY